MIRVKNEAGKFTAEKVFSMTSSEWNSEAHTPILLQDRLFAVGKKENGLFTCLDLDGKQVWTSRDKSSYGLGGYLLADNMFFVLEGKTGTLRLLDANTKEYKELASASLLKGPDVWAPPALSNGKLLVRDLNRLLCLQVK
jgi:hypothetical protein